MFNIIAIIITTLLELHFSQLFSSKADFKVCFEMQKNWVAIFFMSIPAIRYCTDIPNDKQKNNSNNQALHLYENYSSCRVFQGKY